MKIAHYDTDLTDAQWAFLKPLLPKTSKRGRSPKDRRRFIDAILDSQSVKSAGHGGAVGYDAAKQIKGRKRHLLVDTLGLVLGVAAPRPMSPNATARNCFWRVCWVGSPGCASSGWMAAIPARLLPNGASGSVPNWRSRWSSVAITPKASMSCRAAGWWNELSAGSCATAGWCVITKPLNPAPRLGFISR